MTEKLKVLTPSRITEAEFARVIWTATPEPNTPIEDLLTPRFWAHVARKFRPGHRIEACPADAAWWAELLVLSCDEHGANVTILRANDLRPKTAAAQAVASPAASPDDFEAKFMGGEKWCVLRKADRRVIKAKLANEAEALKWIADTYGEGALA